METLSEKIVEIRIKTRQLSPGLNLKTKILFLLKERNSAPEDIMTALSLHKSNLAMLTSSMHRDGLLQKKKAVGDRREIILSITQKGQDVLESMLKEIEAACRKAFDDKEYSEALDLLSGAVSTLDFLL